VSNIPLLSREAAPGLGHNHPPEPLDPTKVLETRLAQTHRELVVRFIDLELGCTRVPNPLQTEADAATATDFIAQCQAHIKSAETSHRQEKEFFLKGGRIVDAFFKRRCAKLASALAPATARLKAYRDEAANRHTEARRAMEAEAERATSEEAEYRAAANRLAHEATSSADRQQAAQQLLLAEEAAARAAAARQAAAFKLEPVRIHGDYGSTAYTRKTWAFEVVDLDQVPREYMSLDVEVVREAINQDSVRDPRVAHLSDGDPACAGRGMRTAANASRSNGSTREGYQALDADAPLSSSIALGVPAFLMPMTISEVKELAKMIALAEWAPECYRDLDGNYLQPKIELAIMQGATVGLGPIASVQSIAIIDGKPCIWGDGALAVIAHSGLLEDMTEEYEPDDDQGLVAVCTMKRCGRATPIVNRFSTAMADDAGLTQIDGPWQTYRARMLRMRARSWTMRDGFADVLRGLHIREEVADFVETRGTTLQRSAERVPSPPLRGYGSPRPQRSTGVGNARPAERLASATKASPGEPLRSGETAPALETFTLVDADGRFIDVKSAEGLRTELERILSAAHLSPQQIVGVWESNEPARKAIEQLFGREALREAEEHLKKASQAPSEDHRAEPATLPQHPVPTRESSAPGKPPAPDRVMVLEINPTWGVRKIFQHYRAAVTALADDPSHSPAQFASLRQANLGMDQRLRAKLPSQMRQIDAIYQRAGLKF